MNFSDGQPKGIKQILSERGLWRRGECRLCRDRSTDPLRVDCCRKIISLQPDFLAQRSALDEMIENSGHVCIFFPKFHCELNFIERYWGARPNDLHEIVVITHGVDYKKQFLVLSI